MGHDRHTIRRFAVSIIASECSNNITTIVILKKATYPFNDGFAGLERPVARITAAIIKLRR